jgi:hypothetical protein
MDQDVFVAEDVSGDPGLRADDRRCGRSVRRGDLPGRGGGRIRLAEDGQSVSLVRFRISIAPGTRPTIREGSVAEERSSREAGV